MKTEVDNFKDVCEANEISNEVLNEMWSWYVKIKTKIYCVLHNLMMIDAISWRSLPHNVKIGKVFYHSDFYVKLNLSSECWSSKTAVWIIEESLDFGFANIHFT